MPNTIPVPTAEELQRLWQNKRARAANRKDIDADQKWAIVLLELHPAVEQPSDYAAIGAAIADVTGITGVDLLVDGRTVASVPAGEKLTAYVEVAIRQEEDES